MGKRFAAGRRGRYEEKGGGQQVGSLFAEATDNEKIKAAYGNYNFWSWLRYRWLDTENYVTFLLYDKGYYDYDFENVPEKREIDRSVLSRSQLNAILGVRPGRPSPAQLQAEVINESKIAAPVP